MSEAPELEHATPKKQAPKKDQFLITFDIRWAFQAHLRVPTTTDAVEQS